MMHRSPSPMGNEQTFSISSLSDCSIGASDNNAASHRGGKSKDKRKRSHRSFEKRYGKRDKKSSRERNAEDYTAFEETNYQNRYQSTDRQEVIQVLESPIRDLDGIETSYIPPRHSAPSDDRLGRLERMVELLVHNKPQAANIPSKEIESKPSKIVTRNPNPITSIWLNKVNQECLDKQYDDTTCIRFMQSRMTGLMKAWFKTLDPYEYTWPEIKMLITKTFPDNVDFASTLRMLVERLKKPDETITQYYFSKMYLLEACKISGENAVSCLIDGLNDPDLQREAKKHSFLTPETLYAHFLTNIPHYGLTSHILPEEPIQENVRNHVVRERDDYRKRNDFKHRDPMHEDRRKCYTCGKFGHLSENCRHAPICYKCNRKGHIAVKCNM